MKKLTYVMMVLLVGGAGVLGAAEKRKKLYKARDVTHAWKILAAPADRQELQEGGFRGIAWRDTPSPWLKNHKNMGEAVATISDSGKRIDMMDKYDGLTWE